MGFIRISKIDRTPGISLERYVGVEGAFVALDSDGKKVTLAFSREGDGPADDFTLSDTEGKGWGHVIDEERDDELYSLAGGQFTTEDWDEMHKDLSDAILRIEEEAGRIAEEAWNDVWVRAAVRAEQFS